MGRMMKTKATKKLVVNLDGELADYLRMVIARDGLNQSMFVQSAITRALKNHKSPAEFIAVGRKNAGLEPLPGALDLTLDRSDGVPLAFSDMNTAADWKYYWNNSLLIRDAINGMRSELLRVPLTDAEWQAIVRYMGSQPGSAKGRAAQTEFGESQDD